MKGLRYDWGTWLKQGSDHDVSKGRSENMFNPSSYE
jgi:hypothetical protein